MKIKIRREYLGVLLDKASTISTSGVPDMGLRTFMLDLDVEGKRLHVLRTDNLASVIAYTDQFTVENADEPHRVLISSEHLLTLVHTLDCDDVVISVPDEHSLEIVAGSYSANWMPFIAKNFPQIPRYTDEKDIQFQKVKSDVLVKAIERVQYMIPHDHYKRFALQVYFDSSGCWAWDGKRFQRVSTNTPNFELTLPKSALSVVKFIKLSGVAEVQFGSSKEHTFVWVGSDFFLYKNANISFPTVTTLHSLDKKRQGYFDFEVAQLKHIVTRMGITSDVTSKRVDFELSSKSLQVSSKDKMDNKSQECMAINLVKVKGMREKFALSWSFFLESLGAIVDKSARMSIDQKHIILESSDSYGVVPMAES